MGATDFYDKMNLLQKATFYRTYPETKSSGKKETVFENITRVKQMHQKKFPHLKDEIEEAFKPVYLGMAMPSMRSMQFAGYAIEKSNARIYNCGYTSIETFKDIADIFWLLMNGCGIGYSVQQMHIQNLPRQKEYDNLYWEAIQSGRILTGFYDIEDTKESWADSIIKLMENPYQQFGYSKIRKKGAKLSTGGTASGPEPLREAHEKVRTILLSAMGRKLKSIEVHDIVCHISDAVVVGGVRRAALICFFDCFDIEMLTCKHGIWFDDVYRIPGIPGEFTLGSIQNSKTLSKKQKEEKILVKNGNKQRGRANNSAVIHRDDPLKNYKIENVLRYTYASNAGEPGIFLTNDYDMFSNPCVEISLISKQMCNLTENIVSNCETEEEFLEAVKSTAIIGTLQASYTDFHYIHPDWKKNCDKDALLGVSLTGQAENWSLLNSEELMEKATKLMKNVNAIWSEKIGINPAARIGCTKPSGTTSAFMNCSSGIHGVESEYSIRRIRIDREDPITKFLESLYGIHQPSTGNILEYDNEKPDMNAVISIPVNKKNDKFIYKDREKPSDLLNRMKFINKNWIKKSHRSGANSHNVSITCYYKNEAEFKEITEWMKENTDYYSGISIFPSEDNTYIQAPFEKITEEEYHKWLEKFLGYDLDFSLLDYTHIDDVREGEVACVGNSCEVK